MNEKQPLLDSYDDYEYDDTKLKSGHGLVPCTAVSEKHGSEPREERPLLRSQGGREDGATIESATWMSHLSSSVAMSALTIPGTHDSAAYTYSWPFIATQTMDITSQLNAGIRYFDLRCGLRSDILEMVHGQAILGLRFEELLADMYAWLDSHPREAIVAQVKQDRKDESSTLHFAQAVTHVIAASPSHWRTANTTPMLGELRGRIQLFRRFESSPYHPLGAYGIDVSRWQDNPERPFTIHTWHDTQITIQDHYSFPDALGLPSLIARKGGDVSELLDLASSAAERPGGENHWFINFTSAFEFNLYYQITPREIAAGAYWAFRWEDGMNVRLRAYLDAHADDRRLGRSNSWWKRLFETPKPTSSRFGIIAMDFPEAGAKDLVMGVVMANFEPRKHKSTDLKTTWSARRPGDIVSVVLVLLFLLLSAIALRYGYRTSDWCPAPIRGCGSAVQ